jgi:hypothetical protein
LSAAHEHLGAAAAQEGVERDLLLGGALEPGFFAISTARASSGA